MTVDFQPSDTSRAVLIVEDNPGDVQLIREHLGEIDHPIPRLEAAGTLTQGLEALSREDFGAVLLDLNLPDSSGLDTLDAVLQAAPDTPVIVLTGATEGDTWLETVRHGASDFLPKGEITGPLLFRSVRYAMERAERYRSQRRFRALIENARDLLGILNADFEVRFVGPSISSILGHRPSDLIGTDSLAAVHPDDRERVAREGRKVVEDSGYVARLQYRVRHADGSWRLLDSVLENRLDDPAIQGLVLNAWDVTDLMTAERELQAARERLEVLQSVSSTANEARRLEEALETLVADLPQQIGWEVCRVYSVQEGRPRMLPLSYVRGQVVVDDSSTPEASPPSSAPGAGLVRAALDSGTTQSYGRDSSGYPFRALDGLEDMRHGVAIPVSVDGGVVAIIELLTASKDPAAASQLVTVGDQIGAQLGRVAERERALRRIRESRNLLHELVEGIPDAMFLKDLEGRYVLINEGGAELLGQSRDMVIGSTDRELLEPGSAEAVIREDRTVLEEGRTINEEQAVTDLHGRTRTYLVTKGPVRDSRGRITGLFGISRDVTELKETQKALHERVKELRVLYGVSRELARTDRPMRDRIRTIVERIPEGWQYPEVTEARIRYGEEVFQTDGFRETSWMLGGDIETTQGVTGRVDVGMTEERPEEDAGPFLREEQQLLDALTLLIGETLERDRLEKEFIHAQKMEAVGRLSGGVAHDFNNLLTVIRAHTDFVLMDLDESDPLAEEVEAIRNASDQAAQLTAQLLAFGKEQVLRPEVLDPNQAVESIRRLVSRVLGEDIRIELRLEEEVPAIQMDPGQLEQALLNLAVNARDAMPEGGTLTLSTELEEIGTDEAAIHPDLEPGRFVRLTVSDTGVGMDENTRSKIFDPFFSTKGREKGTGLGLAMVYGIVTQSGGAVHVESVPGEGARFILRFPAVDADPHVEVGAELPTEEDVDVTGRILLVEDDDAVRRVTLAILERAGFEVEAVGDAEAGLEALGADGGPFEGVLTDLVLPGMNGRELLDRVKERLPDVPVVAMSGYAERSPGRTRGLPEEILFLRKPFTAEDLVDTLRKALVQRRS